MKKTFCTPVAMPVNNATDAQDIFDWLTAIGYSETSGRIKPDWTPTCSVVVTNYGGEPTSFGFVPASLGEYQTIYVPSFNMPLFKALAAMRSEGWGKGEWVKHTGTNEVGVMQSDLICPNHLAHVCFIGETYNEVGPHSSVAPYLLVKLTVSEILEHFKPQVTKETFEQSCTNNIAETIERIKRQESQDKHEDCGLNGEVKIQSDCKAWNENTGEPIPANMQTAKPEKLVTDLRRNEYIRISNGAEFDLIAGLLNEAGIRRGAGYTWTLHPIAVDPVFEYPFYIEPANEAFSFESKREIRKDGGVIYTPDEFQSKINVTLKPVSYMSNEEMKQRFPHKSESEGVTISAEKPPLGITPRWFLDENRANEIWDAIGRYALSGKEWPKDWMDELLSIAERRPLKFKLA